VHRRDTAARWARARRAHALSSATVPRRPPASRPGSAPSAPDPRRRPGTRSRPSSCGPPDGQSDLSGDADELYPPRGRGDGLGAGKVAAAGGLDRLERNGGGVGPRRRRARAPGRIAGGSPEARWRQRARWGQATERRVVRAHSRRASQPGEGRRVQAVGAQEAGLHALLAPPPPERPHLLRATRKEDEIRALGLERDDDGVNWARSSVPSNPRMRTPRGVASARKSSTTSWPAVVASWRT
jgi:hypothetical protein